MINGVKMYLYKISFPEHLTTKCYIGITSQSLGRRLNGHCKLSNDSLISKAIRKYGKENTIISIVSECNNWELLCLAEMEAIEKFNTFASNGNGYNLTLGGDGLNGHVFSNEHRTKLSLSLSGRIFTKETLKKMSDSAKEKVITPEHRKNLLDSQKGDKHPNFGKKLSTETRLKISSSLTGKTASIETRKKQSIAHSNISDETRLKLSKGSRNRPSIAKHGFKGVSKTKEGNKWRARCVVFGKEKLIGTFDTAEEASVAYQKFVANL